MPPAVEPELSQPPAVRPAPAIEKAAERIAEVAAAASAAPATEPPTAEIVAEEPPAVAGAPKISAFDFAVDALRMTPEMTYQDLKARAGLVGLQMPPIVYGRAKALLGLVPTKPRRSKVEPPRLLRQVDSAESVDRMPALDGIRSLEQLVETVRALENERRRLNALLAAINDVVKEALAADDAGDVTGPDGAAPPV